MRLLNSVNVLSPMFQMRIPTHFFWLVSTLESMPFAIRKELKTDTQSWKSSVAGSKGCRVPIVVMVGGGGARLLSGEVEADSDVMEVDAVVKV